MTQSLATRQRAFLDHVRGLDARRPLLADGAVPATRGLAVYVHAYRARLREALDADHPRLARRLGPIAWRVFCDAYIDARPSRAPSLRTFGNDVPAFLATRVDEAIGALDVELAAFERHLLDAFDAADAPRVTWVDIEAVPGDAWPTSCVQLHPSVHRLALTTPAVAVWQRLGDDVDESACTVPESVPASVVLWRDTDRITRFRTLAMDEDTALAGLLVGDRFAALCERQRAIHPETAIPALAVGWLRAWVDEGLVSAFA